MSRRPPSTARSLLVGLGAGAAGTTALNAVTYLDMAVRGRGTSSTPEDSVEALAERAGVTIPGAGDTRSNRLAGLGALSGIAVGLGVGGVFGLLRAAGLRPGPAVGAVAAGLVAMAATDGSMAALGVSDPRTWHPADWLADAVPHLAYGVVTAWMLQAGDQPRP